MWAALCEPFVEELLEPERSIDEQFNNLHRLVGVTPTLHRRLAEVPHHVHVHLKDKHEHPHQ